MKYSKRLFAVLMAALLILTFALTACNKNSGNPGSSSSGGVVTAAPVSDATSVPVADPADQGLEATGEFTITAGQGSGTVNVNANTFTITSAGEYTLSGKLEDGQVIVNADEDDEVYLILSGASISCSTGAPILILCADKVHVKSDDGSYNTVCDARTVIDDKYDAAIWSDCDLKLSGKGTLIVTANAENGVKAKDDLSVKNVTLKVTAPGNALKGNDSVTVESGELMLISTGSDGIKTSNSGVSGKGNQRGTISILDGQVDIYAACDGISAEYNAEIAGGTVNIYTSTYAGSEGSTVSSEVYLIVPSSLYSESTDYYFYVYNDDDTAGVWVKCTYETMVYSGRNASYYGLVGKLPDGYTNVLVNTVPSGTVPDGSNYTATSGGETINTSMNGYLISDITAGIISADWVKLSSGSGDSSKTTYSSKGIKAANDIVISGGTIAVYSMDDGLHANAGNQLENGTASSGCITISGGSLTVKCADDGLHADGTLEITDGLVNIAESHEGVEANVINIGGGALYVNGSDDGVNVCAGSATPLLNITGGYVEVTVGSGDTDAIDSNGNITMSGGFVLVKSGAAMGGMAGSVDVDGSITVTGGSIVALGGICETPTSGSVNTYISSGTSFSQGEYTLTDANGSKLFSFTLNGSYSSCWIASDLIELNGSYTLACGGSTVLSWTQSSQTEGSAGNMGGFGGFGGRGQGGRP